LQECLWRHGRVTLVDDAATLTLYVEANAIAATTTTSSSAASTTVVVLLPTLRCQVVCHYCLLNSNSQRQGVALLLEPRPLRRFERRALSSAANITQQRQVDVISSVVCVYVRLSS